MADRRPEHGQNFLRSRRLTRQLLAKTSITSHDLVLDIGAGYGALTQVLAERGRRVVAYEIDPDLFRSLERRFKASPKATLVHADFLSCELPREPYKVFANLPFNITADVVAKLTSGIDPPRDAYLIVQREAAARFVADGSGPFTLVANLLYPTWHVRTLGRIPAAAFSPPPRVDAALLQLKPRPHPLIPTRDEALFQDLVTHCFMHGTSLRKALRPLLTPTQLRRISRDQRLQLDQSPAEVRPRQWIELTRFIADHPGEVNVFRVRGSRGRLERRQRRLHKTHRTRVQRRRC